MEEKTAMAIILAGIYVAVPIGFFIFKKMRLKKYQRWFMGLSSDEKNLEVIKIQTKVLEARTSHTLHFLISFFTIGTWIVVWIFVTASNQSQRKYYEKMISNPNNPLA